MLDILIACAIGAIALLGVINLAAALLTGDTLTATTNATIVGAVSIFVVCAFVAGCANRAPKWDAYRIESGQCEPSLVITDRGIEYRDCR